MSLLFKLTSDSININLSNSELSKLEPKIILSQNLKIADNFWTRMKGLLGTYELKNDEMLWIKMCNSIHTFFMKYPIDCIFLDDKLVVQEIKANILPWRATLPVIKSISVIEMRSGQAEVLGIKKGDKFYVVT